MSVSIRNVNDKHFRSMVAKLETADWISDVTYTPTVNDKLGNVEFVWTAKGHLLLTLYKLKAIRHKLWSECHSFVQAFNEQEEAFFHENFIKTIPDVPRSS
jgi:hypothetical protein